MKKILATMLALVMALTLLPTAWADAAMSGSCGADGISVNWALTQNNSDSTSPTYTLTISGSGAMANYTGANQGQPWTDKLDSITKIVVENGVTAIGDYAFMNATKAQTVELPEGLEKIGQRAFAYCQELQSPAFPSTLTEIGANPFYACNSFNVIVLPDNLTTMGEMLFYECANLTSITIPANATSLPAEFVKGCGKLESIQIPAKITSIGQAAFSATGLKAVTIPATVTTLGTSLFYGCTQLEKVTFEGSATVPSATFGNCTALKTIVFTANSFGVYQETNNNVFHTGGDKCTIILTGSAITAESIAAIEFTLQQLVGGHDTPTSVVTLVPNGGTISGEAWGASLATPTKTGYTFGGWYTGRDFSGSAVTTATAGTTYYAKWVKEITFDANGGSGSMSNQQVAENATAAALTANGFTRTGWDFSGWNTKADGTGMSYAGGADATGIANGTTLYAQWVCAGHTATAATWKYDKNSHWNECDTCKAKMNESSHDYNGRTCTVCGYTKPVYRHVDTPTETVESPKTFDAGIAVYGVMAVSSVLGMGYMGKKKF